MHRPRIDDLDWDTWYLEHIDKHGVSRDEVEEAVAGDAQFRASYKNRLMATGPTLDGRMLTVVIGESPHRSHLYYGFSARPASRQERRDYMSTMRGERT